MPPKTMMETMRSHWGVENNLHWPLDVVFNEDDARTRNNHAPQNLSFIRRMSLDILKAHADNRSVARKMKLAGWKKEFLFELFVHMPRRQTRRRANAVSAGQQAFGDDLLRRHRFVAIPSAVSTHSWNLIFDPLKAASFYSLDFQEPFALDTRLHPPAS